jgi:hypothetical protein
MVEYVVCVGGGIVVADDTGVLRLARLVHVAAHREPCRAVVLLVLHLTKMKVSESVFRIRIHYMRIRIQPFGRMRIRILSRLKVKKNFPK